MQVGIGQFPDIMAQTPQSSFGDENHFMRRDQNITAPRINADPPEDRLATKKSPKQSTGLGLGGVVAFNLGF